MVFKPTPLSKIEALAASNQSEALGDPGGPPPGQSPPPSPTKGQHGSTFVKEWVRKHLPSANGPRRWNNGLIYEFLCPWRESDGNSAFLADLPNGISAGCQHATCAGSRSTGNHWYDLRTLLEGPDWRKSDATEAKATSGFNDEAARPLIKFDTTEWGDRQPKEVQWLIDGQLALGETGLLAGPPNCGKGLLSIQIATAIATGSNLFGKKGPLTPMAVIMVQMEDSEEEVERRYARCLKLNRHESDWSDQQEALLKQNIAFFGPNWSSDASKGLPALVPHIIKEAQAHQARGCQIGLIVIDTFTAVSAGDENSVEGLREIWPAAYALRDATGANVTLVHHVRKSLSGNSMPSIGERLAPDALRGSSSIPAGARCIQQMEPLKPAEAVRLELDDEKARRGGFVILALTKVVSGPKGGWILLEQQDGGFWAPHPKSDHLCAMLQSKKALEDLTQDEAILLSIAGGCKDRKELGRRHWPSETEKQQAKLLKGAMNRLRGRHGWIQRGNSFDLTVAGSAKVNALKTAGNQDGNHRDPDETHDDQSTDSP